MISHIPRRVLKAWNCSIYCFLQQVFESTLLKNHVNFKIELKLLKKPQIKIKWIMFWSNIVMRITLQRQLCPNGQQIIMNNIFLPVSYCLLTETLSNYNWVTIRQSCGVSEHTTKEKKTLKKWKLVPFKYLTIKSKALASRQHVLLPTKSDRKLGKLSGQYERIFFSK